MLKIISEKQINVLYLIWIHEVKAMKCYTCQNIDTYKHANIIIMYNELILILHIMYKEFFEYFESWFIVKTGIPKYVINKIILT